MQFWVVDDSSGTGLAIIGTRGFSPEVHYGTPPIMDGQPVTDASLLRKMRGYVSPVTGNIVELQQNEDHPPAFWLDREVTPEQWRCVTENPLPQGADAIVPTVLVRAVLKPDATAQRQATDLSLAKAQKRMEIDRRYMLEAYSPFPWTNGKTYQISPELERGLSIVNAGKTSIEWTAADNTRQAFTGEEFKSLCTAIFDRGQAKFLVRRAKKDEVNSLTTTAAVNAYDVNAGWT